MRKQKRNSLPNILMLITLTSEDGRYDQNFLGNYALINIKDTLARIKGIGRVNVIGASDYSMRVWIKPDRLVVLPVRTGQAGLRQLGQGAIGGLEGHQGLAYGVFIGPA